MSNEKILQFALNELTKMCNMDLSLFSLGQSIVCHGFAGTAAITYLMYKDEGKIEFLNKTI